MPLPAAVNHQDRLLSLNIHEEPGVAFDHVVPGLKLWPLFLDPENGVWVLYARYRGGTRLPRHFHTGQVHFFTTKGRWNYAEYPDDVQSPGSYLYEPPGSVHSLSVPDDVEVMEGFMVVNGVNINFDSDGNYLGTDHAGSMEEIILQAAREQGVPLPRYMRPGARVGVTA